MRIINLLLLLSVLFISISTHLEVKRIDTKLETTYKMSEWMLNAK